MNKKEKINLIRFNIVNSLKCRDKTKQELEYIKRRVILPEIEFDRAINHLLEKSEIKKYKEGRKVYYSTKRVHGPQFNKVKDLLDNSFGVEIELGSKIMTNYFPTLLKEAGIDSEGDGSYTPYECRDYEKWAVVTDASISVPDYPFTVEFVSPILRGYDGLIELYKVLDFINNLKKFHLVKGNKTCGTHVHHGEFKVPIKRFIDLAEKTQSMMNLFVARHRIISDEMEDTYISPAKKEKYFENGRIKWDDGKYINISIRNYKINGTIEFRQLETTSNFSKLYQWIIIGQKIIQNAKRNDEVNEIRNLNQFYEFVY